MPSKVKFTLVANDCFTKWAKIEAIATIDQGNVIKFIWMNIICRYGLPQAIVSDNDKQFNGLKIYVCFQKWKITKLISTPTIPSPTAMWKPSTRSLNIR